MKVKEFLQVLELCSFAYCPYLPDKEERMVRDIARYRLRDYHNSISGELAALDTRGGK